MAERPRLKAMSPTEMLDLAFRLYRNNFITFLGITAIPHVPITLLHMAGLLFFQDGVDNAEEASPLLSAAEAVEFAYASLFMLIAAPVSAGALTWAVGARYLQEPTSVADAYRRILNILGTYLWTTSLSGLAIIVGLFFCLVPGFIFMTSFFAIAPVCVLEEFSGTAAMGRSRDLTRGFGWKVFGLIVLVYGLQCALAIPLAMGTDAVVPRLVDGEANRAVLSLAVQELVSLLTAPFYGVVFVLLYYDLRIRKEAFDLEVLARSLGKAAPLES